MRPPRLAAAGLLATAALGSSSAPAGAQDPGVVVDPDSPTGKEYAIPLESARRRADPKRGSNRSNEAQGAAPLFGEGIRPRAEGTEAREAQSAPPPSDTGSRADVSAPEDVRRASRAIAAGGPSAGGGAGSTLIVVGGGLAVLAFGAAGGLLLRGRRKP